MCCTHAKCIPLADEDNLQNNLLVFISQIAFVRFGLLSPCLNGNRSIFEQDALGESTAITVSPAGVDKLSIFACSLVKRLSRAISVLLFQLFIWSENWKCL